MITRAREIPANIPAGATAIYYRAGNGKCGTYYLWDKTEMEASGEYERRWYWSALGNEGVAGNAQDAVYDAQEWIRNGVRGRAGKHEEHW